MTLTEEERSQRNSCTRRTFTSTAPCGGLERYEGAPVEEMRNATRSALKNMVRLCLDEQVDLLLISGDISRPGMEGLQHRAFFHCPGRQADTGGDSRRPHPRQS
ncbi:MAG: hypothetical protein MZV70_65820 [Desulfobacterales bacterium]|nr:hypothetical protein [Desulfobacterales bacterium]